MKPTENQEKLPLSLVFLKSLVAGMGIVLIGGFVLVISMIMLGMKYFTDLRTCDSYPKGDITLEKLPKDSAIKTIDMDCGIIKVETNQKLYGFESETGKLRFTVTY